jgi:hypothetical protein
MPSLGSGSRSHRTLWHLAVLALYLALAVALTHPLAAQLASVVPSDLGDPLLNTWILWWNARTVPFTAEWWNAPSFFPAEGVLAFSEHLLGLAPITSPVIWLTGDPQVAYNLALLLSFPLSAFAAYVLCLELTGRRDAALVGGLAFGFAPYRIAQLPHLQVLAAFWMPLGLLALHRYVRSRAAGWLVVLGAAWLLQGLSNGYYLAFFSVLVGLWVVRFVPWRDWKTMAAIALTLAIAVLPLVPIILGYQEVHERFDFRRGIDEIRLFSADVFSLLDTAPSLALWGWLRVYHRPEGELFPGLTVVALLLAGLMRTGSPGSGDPGLQPSQDPESHLSPDPGPERATRRRLRALLWGVAALFGLLALSAAWSPWQWSAGGLSVSVTSPHKPLSFTILCLFALGLTSRPVVRAFRQRSSWGFYLLAAAATWILALGPMPTVLGEPVMYQAPYAWLFQFPGFDALRVPARFAMMMILCMSAAAALAFGRMAPMLSNGSRFALAAALAGGIAADGWVRTMPLEARPQSWGIQASDLIGPVVEFPLGDRFHDVVAMYRAMSHGLPLVNGFSGNFPSWYGPLRIGLERRDPDMLSVLSALGARHIVVDVSGDPERAWRALAERGATNRPAPTEAGFAFYDLPPEGEHAVGHAPGNDLPVAELHASINPGLLSTLTDGDLFTRWESGPQLGAEELVVDLGGVLQVGGVRLSLGPFVDAFPRELIVDVSADGAEWTTVWQGPGAGPATLAAVRDPRAVPLTIDFAGRAARFVKLRQTGEDATSGWSMAELDVFGP